MRRVPWLGALALAMSAGLTLADNYSTVEIYSDENCDSTPLVVTLEADTAKCNGTQSETCSPIQINNSSYYYAQRCASDRFEYTSQIFSGANYLMIDVFDQEGCEGYAGSNIFLAAGTCQLASYMGQRSEIATLFNDGSAYMTIYNDSACGKKAQTFDLNASIVQDHSCYRGYNKFYTTDNNGVDLGSNSGNGSTAGIVGSTGDGSMSTGALFGIVVACLAIVICPALLVYWRMQRAKKSKNKNRNREPDSMLAISDKHQDDDRYAVDMSPRSEQRSTFSSHTGGSAPIFRSDELRIDPLRSDELRSDRKRGERRRSNEPRSDRKRSEEQRSDRRGGDRFRGDRARGGKIRSNELHDEPIHSDPVRSDRLRMKELHDGAVHSDPARGDRMRSNELRGEPIHSEPVRSDRLRSDRQRSNERRGERMRSGDLRDDPVQPDRSNQMGSDALRSGSDRSEPLRSDDLRNEPAPRFSVREKLRGPVTADSVCEDDAVLSSRVPRDKVLVEELISRGGYGEVYRGTYEGKLVAIKMLFPETRKSMRHVKEFLTEVKMMTMMNHPRVVKFIGVSWTNLMDLCVVTEFMEGGDLRSWLSDRADNECPTGFDYGKVKIAAHVVHALAYLHSLNPPLIHRDLKSRNILLSKKSDAKLADFGASRERVDRTMTAGVGTSLWIAPEVMMGERYDEKADMFSFGVVLSELDSQLIPYAHAKENNKAGRKMPETAILQLVAMGKLRVEFSPGALKGMVQLGTDCTAIDPTERPTAEEALLKLQTLLAQEAKRAGKSN